MVVKKILVIKNRAMGDSLMGLSTISYIKQIFPKASLFYAIPKWITPLYEKVDFNEEGVVVVPLDLNGWKGWIHFFKILRREKFNIIYEMHQSGRSGRFLSIYSTIFNTPYFFHNHHLGQEIKSGVLDQGIIKPLIQRDLDGAYSFLSHFSPSSPRPCYLDFSPKLKIRGEEQKKSQAIIFGVVATRQTKQWPFENFLELAKLLYNKYPDYQILIPLSKSIGDIEIYEKIKKFDWPPSTKIVFWPLSDLPEMIKKTMFYIGNDTGLKHLAVSVGVKTYTFFGPEPPLEWHPYDTKRHPYFFWEDLECRTKTHHYCGLSHCESMICLKSFRPLDVLKAIDLEDESL